MKTLYIVLGRTCSGKTSVVNELIKRGVGKNLVSFTTREPRENEVNGVDYHFITNEVFKNTDVVASFSVNEHWHYGVSKDELLKVKNDNLFFPVISLSYGLELANSAQDLGINVVFIYFDIDKNIRYQRLLNRGDTIESIEKRFDIEDTEGIIDINNFKDFDSIIFSEKHSENTRPLEVYANILTEVINGYSEKNI